ncbi:uncharacterized protein PV07_09130 [Cladophialophora immunda]|uniref:NmrA-like domain-containing protein n=1 Tax=Cladophialophora immunda TaxID=569365 RepID=A0A0D2CR09_9EURO|nr:uncharacterized protein PV07_09130 [Cladophialophora immunda]KIW25999.1 hypothetical protein PV07_09130 [Cladophialophora immunda]
MTSVKVIVVPGATGNQGGSVVETFLKEPGWHVRGITRNPSSVKAQALSARRVEIVQADMDEPKTLELAFKSATAIFAVSDFWGLYGDPANKDKPKPGTPLNVWAAGHEEQQLKNVIDTAAKVPTLERFIVSSLSNATKCSKGKYSHVYHFDSKARAVDYGRGKYPDLWKRTSIFQAGFFLSNYVRNPFTQPQRNPEGVVQFIGQLDPDVKMPMIAPEEDTGPVVKALVKEAAGKNVIAYREWISVRELAQTFTEMTGLNSEVIMLSKTEANLLLPPELKLELDDNFAYFNEFGYEGRDDPTVIHPSDLSSPPDLDSVANYLKKQDWSKVLTA